MASNDYRFETCWRMWATAAEIAAILGKPRELPRWWPEVYIKVDEPETGVFRLLTKGWLPYRLRWCFRVVENRAPYGFTIQAWGDLEGRGVWTLEEEGEWTNVRYVWTVRAAKPLLRHLSWVMKPVFAANHRWAMEKGEAALERELARVRSLRP